MLGRTALVLLAAGVIAWLPAAGNAIGMAVTNGSFQVDHSRVWGNSTLFDGSTIETAKASSQLQLSGGVQMRLAADTRATVYRGKLILERGLAQLESASGYQVEARTLRIFPVAPDTVARIQIENGRKVLVAAVRGAVRVTNASGVLVARLEAGDSLNFEPQAAGAAAPTRASGCLLEKSGKLIVAEQTTNLILELQGTDLEKELGNHVEITGMAATRPPTVAGASQMINVAAFKQLRKGGCTAVAKKIGAAAVAVTAAAAGTAAGAAGVGAVTAAGAAGAATAAGIGAGTIAVIGGVATAATFGGLFAAGDLPGQADPPPPASR